MRAKTIRRLGERPKVPSGCLECNKVAVEQFILSKGEKPEDWKRSDVKVVNSIQCDTCKAWWIIPQKLAPKNRHERRAMASHQRKVEAIPAPPITDTELPDTKPETPSSRTDGTYPEYEEQ